MGLIILLHKQLIERTLTKAPHPVTMAGLILQLISLVMEGLCGVLAYHAGAPYLNCGLLAVERAHHIWIFIETCSTHPLSGARNMTTIDGKGAELFPPSNFRRPLINLTSAL